MQRTLVCVIHDLKIQGVRAGMDVPLFSQELVWLDALYFVAPWAHLMRGQEGRCCGVTCRATFYMIGHWHGGNADESEGPQRKLGH